MIYGHFIKEDEAYCYPENTVCMKPSAVILKASSRDTYVTFGTIHHPLYLPDYAAAHSLQFRQPACRQSGSIQHLGSGRHWHFLFIELIL
jgi:hypothetical protein